MGNSQVFVKAKDPITYDNLLSEGSVEDAGVQGGYEGQSAFHKISEIGSEIKDVDTDIFYAIY